MDRPGRLVDYLITSLHQVGVRHIFGVGGANIEDLYDAVHHCGEQVTAVVAKHEFSAAAMADGYARATGRLAVAVSTSGGGAMNLVPGVAEAYASRVPLLAIVGQPPRPLEGQGAFQDTSGLAGSFDAYRLFSSISRYCRRIDDPADIAAALADALTATRALPGGPAVLLLPKDVQQAVVEGLPPIDELLAERRISVTAAAARDRAGDRLAELVGESVLVIAGDEVARRGARAELAEFAAALDARVAVVPDGKDVYPNDDPRFVGVAGVIGHPSVTDALRGARLCVLVGTRLPVMARGGLDALLTGTELICFGAEPAYAAHALHVDGDLRAELRAAVDRLRAHRPTPPAPTRPDLRFLSVPPFEGEGVLRLREAVDAIDAAVPDGATVVADAGNSAASVIHYLATPRDGRFIVALGMGGMGHSLGAGIGAAFGTGRRSFVVIGDGGFLMHGMEIHTAVEHDLPVTFVVVNNNAHGMCVTREQLYYEDAYTFNEFRPTDLAAGIRGMFPGLPVTHARTPDELRQALTDQVATRSPAVVCIDVSPREIPPFVPFLNHLDQTVSPQGAPHEPVVAVG
ncbi:thiamine pyrophosphate-binding protein [Micromonospora sp. WMMD882]|nr:thiamine pyrophosphate-binding protein [Micromonospora sp. WMMD882]WBB81393.1 thiamine pyrophosphate-binding protein [Micromonospora sp. WMMD882]